jgi:hypothetical protein
MLHFLSLAPHGCHTYIGAMPDREPHQTEPDDPEQSRRFIDVAREVEADEAPETDIFQRVVRRLGDTPKEPRRPKTGAPKRR